MSALTEALVLAQGELPTAIGRDSQGLGYRYTSLDKLIEATRPILTRNGLTLTQWPTVVPREEGKLAPVLVSRLSHTSGESYEQTCPLYVADATMQGLGAAITYARRYAWAAALGIASEEDTDGSTISPADESIPF